MSDISSHLSSLKQENLVALYHETWGEIHRLRDLEWKITAYFLTLSAGLIALLTTEVVPRLLSTKLRITLTVLQVISAGFAWHYLRQTHFYLTQQRNIRRRIEEVFGFFDSGTFAATPILPIEWKGRVVTAEFQRADLLFPLMLMVFVVQGFTIFVTWKV